MGSASHIRSFRKSAFKMGCCDPSADCCGQATCCTEAEKCCPSKDCCTNKVDYNLNIANIQNQCGSQLRRITTARVDRTAATKRTAVNKKNALAVLVVATRQAAAAQSSHDALRIISMIVHYTFHWF